ncbi:MAG: MATE family efflux transporter, partial [Ruthenibacterium lactatiformans]
MNAVLQHYGGAARGDALVTCATIAQSFMLVVTMPLGGITGGTQSILSYNYGAYRTERVRQAQKYIFGLGLAFTAVMTLAARLAGPLFVRLFTTDEALAAQAFDTIKVCTLALLPLGLQYEVVDGFTALGLAKLALPLSLWRKAVYFAAVFA